MNVVATKHAVRRFRKRENDQRSWLAIAEQIEAEVRAGLEAGRVFDHKPKQFRLYKETRSGMRDGNRFVEHEDGSRGYVVSEEEDAVVVLSTLNRVVAETT